MCVSRIFEQHVLMCVTIGCLDSDTQKAGDRTISHRYISAIVAQVLTWLVVYGAQKNLSLLPSKSSEPGLKFCIVTLCRATAIHGYLQLKLWQYVFFLLPF